MNLRSLFLFWSLLFIPLCPAADFSLPDATPENFVGGPDNLKLVKGANAIKVFRVVDLEKKVKGLKTTMIDNQKCHANPVVVRGPEVEQTITAMSDMTNFGQELMCIFDPGVIFRFETEKENLDLMICFHCHEMILFKNGELVRRPIKWAASKNTFSKDARRAFVAVAKAAFPKDREIQSIKN